MDVQHQQLDLQQLPQLFLQLQQQLQGLQQQVQQHSNILSRLDALEEENNSLKKDNRAKDLVIAHLQGHVKSRDGNNSSATGGSQDSQIKASNNPATTQSSYIGAANKGKNATPPASKPVQSQKRLLALGRTFKTLDSKGPQGFEYIYIGRSGKIARTEVRSKFRKAGVDNGRILDICFPASGVIGVLMHIQYVPIFCDLMAKLEADVIKDFDSLDPANIADPKYDCLSSTDREDLIQEFVEARAIQTLSFLRPLNVSSVGKYFESLGWINAEILAESVADAMKRLAKAEPKKAAFLSRRRIATSNGSNSGNSDSDMDE